MRRTVSTTLTAVLIAATTFGGAKPIQPVDAQNWPDRTTLPISLSPFEGEMEATVPARFGVDTFGIGMDSGQPVTDAYQPPFRFTGTIDKVVVEMQ